MVLAPGWASRRAGSLAWSGVTKAYATRVGGGPFPTEDTTQAGELMRERGREYGSVTRRSRRCGWLDLPGLRYGVMVNGLDSLIVTKLDILDALDEIPVCIAYQRDGSPTQELPAVAEAWESVRPVYRTLPGWKQSTFGVTRYEQLPNEARAYLEFVREQLGVEIAMISTGPERDQTVVVPGTRLEQLLPSPVARPA